MQVREPFEDIYKRPLNPLLFVISGPSGVGKDATLQRLRELNCNFHFVVTATTRPRRETRGAWQGLFFCQQGRIC